MARFGRRTFLTAAGTAAGFAAAPGTVAADGVAIGGPTDELLSLSPPNFPENLAIDANGDLLVGITAGEVRRIPQDATDETGLELDDTEAVATFPGEVGGVAVSDGTVYAAVRTESEDTTGVYGVVPATEREDGDADGPRGPALLASIPGFPNDVLVDTRHDRLLVTESSSGAVYTEPLVGDSADIEAGSRDEAPLLTDDSLLTGESFGANGLTFFGGGILVANTDEGRLVYVPIESDGSAGDPQTYVEDDGLLGADGISALGPVVYVAANRRNELVRVLPGGRLSVAANADDGLQFPSDVVFGTSPERGFGPFVCNFAVQAEDPEPGVLRTGL